VRQEMFSDQLAGAIPWTYARHRGMLYHAPPGDAQSVMLT
jgi:hypothetical protein